MLCSKVRYGHLTDPTDKASFEFSHGSTRLIALVDIDQHVGDGFERACQRLLDSDGPEVLIDLSRVGYVNSSCLGILIFTNERAKEQRRRLRLKVHERLVGLLDLMSIREFIETEVAGS